MVQNRIVKGNDSLHPIKYFNSCTVMTGLQTSVIPLFNFARPPWHFHLIYFIVPLKSKLIVPRSWILDPQYLITLKIETQVEF